MEPRFNPVEMGGGLADWVLCLTWSPLHAVYPETPFSDTHSRKLLSSLHPLSESRRKKIMKYLSVFCKSKGAPTIL